MKTAKGLLIEFINSSWSDPGTMLGLFAQDGAQVQMSSDDW